MDTQPDRPDNVSDLERRLASHAPAADGLDADAMLFAAGRAAGRPGHARFIWPTLTACLAALAVVLGVWLGVERTERRDLAEQLKRSISAPLVPPSPAPPAPMPEPPTANEPSSNSLLAAHRALEQGLDDWPPLTVPPHDTPGPLPPDPPILRVGRPDTLPDL
jgi:hypothetical protein